MVCLGVLDHLIDGRDAMQHFDPAVVTQRSHVALFHCALGQLPTADAVVGELANFIRGNHQLVDAQTPLRARDVIRLHMGNYTVPLDFPRAPHLQGAAIIVDAFLLRHPSGPILLDTGLASGHAKAEAIFHPVIRPFDDVLREAALLPKETRAVANCPSSASQWPGWATASRCG